MIDNVDFSEYTKEILEENNTTKLCDYSENLLSCFEEAINNNCISEFWNSLSEEEKKLEAIANYLDIRDNEEKQKVYYFSVLSTIIGLSKELNKKALENEEFKLYHNYKYIFPILECLSKNNLLSHSELAECLDISTHTLSNFNKRTESYNLWVKKSEGKYRYYVITAKGKNVYRQYCKDELKNNENNLEKILVNMLESISIEMNKPNPSEENVLYHFNKNLNNGTVIINSDILKLKINSIFTKDKTKNKKDNIQNNIKPETKELTLDKISYK